MARTYYSEGRNIAYVVKGLSVLFSVIIYFYMIPDTHFLVFIGMVFGSIILGEVAGSAWTRMRRKNSKARKSFKNSPKKRTTSNQRIQTNKKLPDSPCIPSEGGIDESLEPHNVTYSLDEYGRFPW